MNTVYSREGDITWMRIELRIKNNKKHIENLLKNQRNHITMMKGQN